MSYTGGRPRNTPWSTPPHGHNPGGNPGGNPGYNGGPPGGPPGGGPPGPPTNVPRTPRNPVDSWKRGQKRDALAFTDFKSDMQFTVWRRHTVAQARS